MTSPVAPAQTFASTRTATDRPSEADTDTTDQSEADQEEWVEIARGQAGPDGHATLTFEVLIPAKWLEEEVRLMATLNPPPEKRCPIHDDDNKLAESRRTAIGAIGRMRIRHPWAVSVERDTLNFDTIQQPEQADTSGVNIMRSRTLAVFCALVLLAGCSNTADNIAESIEDQPGPTAASQQEVVAAESATLPTAASVPDAIPQTVNASPWVAIAGGNRPPTLPAGEMGSVAVIGIGPVDKSSFGTSATVPVLLRNMTSEYVVISEVTGIARNAGDLVGTGSDQGFEPVAVGPGEISFGYVYFSDVGAAAGDAIDIEVTAKADRLEDTYSAGVPLEITEVVQNDDALVGLLANNIAELDASGPISVDAICIGDDGTPLTTAQTFADQDSIASGETGSFTLDLYGAICDGVWILASSGYSF